MPVVTPLALCAAAGAFCIALGIGSRQARLALRVQDMLHDEYVETTYRPSVWHRLESVLRRVAPLLRGVVSARSTRHVRRLLDWAGWSLAPETFYAAKALCAVAGFVLGTLAALVAGSVSWSPILGVVLALTGWVLPDTYLDRRVRAVRARVGREALAFGDFLVAAVGAGLPLEGALEQLGGELRGRFTARLSAVAARTRLTRENIDLALQDFAAEVDDPQATSLIGAIIQARSVGGDLVGPLSGLLTALSQERIQRLRTTVRSRGATGFAPLILVLFPGILVPIGYLLMLVFRQSGF